jgi:transcriptional regulator with XRE-family HTH domain
MSQERLADCTGLDRSFISLIERGIQTPNLVVLFKLGEILELPASELVIQTEQLLKKHATPTSSVI